MICLYKLQEKTSLISVLFKSILIPNYIQQQTNYQCDTDICENCQRINQIQTTKIKYTDLSNMATVQNTSIMQNTQLIGTLILLQVSRKTELSLTELVNVKAQIVCQIARPARIPENRIEMQQCSTLSDSKVVPTGAQLEVSNMIVRIYEQTIPYIPRIIKPRIIIFIQESYPIYPDNLKGKGQDSIVKAMLIIYMGLFTFTFR